ncbi:MAG: hypothetical protein Q9225_004454, partial [Loekoesia sp. 1 TL-2023]
FNLHISRWTRRSIGTAVSHPSSHYQRITASARPSETFDIIIVGAGISGIAAARFYLEVHPNCRLVVLEKANSVGGVWNSERVFDTFYTQSPLGTWEYSEMPMPKPPEEDIYKGVFKARHTSQYLENYTDRRVYGGKSLRERILFGYDVQRITKEAGEWTISGIHTSEGTKTLRSARVVIASGLTSVPNMPTLPGQEKFGNPIVHQKDFGRSGVLSSSDLKRIIVLGAGKSAADMVYDSVKAGKTVTWIISATGTGPAFFVSADSKLSPSTLYLIGTLRILATLSPSIFNADSWWNKFLQGTQMGRNQLNKVHDSLNKSVVEAPKFDSRGPEAEKRGFKELMPHTPVFWQNQPAGLVNRPDFWDTIADNVQIYHADIEALENGIIRSKDGREIHSDAILCGTGWVPSLSFFDQDTLAELGIPQPLETYPPEEAKAWDALEKDADRQVLKRFPMLANPPKHYHNPVTHTPYRLYNGIAPLNDNSIAFVGHVLVANYFRVVECQAIWATAYLDGKVDLPSLEQRQKDVAFFVAWCRRRYLSNGDRGHWLAADQTGYTDTLFRELGLSSHRGFWLWDSFLPSTMKDLRSLRAEYIAKFGQDTELVDEGGSIASNNRTPGVCRAEKDLED